MNRFLCATMVICVNVAADDQPTPPTELTPLDVIADCLDAVRQKDFQRYVNHLAPDEQRLQAGVVLLLQTESMVASAAEESPDVLLLSFALNDLRKKHSVPGPENGQNHTAAAQAEAYQQFANAVLQAGSVYGVSMTQSPVAARQHCIQSAAVLKHPDRFLTDVLTEISQPTLISGKRPQHPPKSAGMAEYFTETCREYSELEFTLYTRGNYAIAVADLPEPEPVPATALPGSTPADTTASASPAPNPCLFDAPAASPTPSIAIQFTRIDGQWRISQLFQLKNSLSM